VTGIYFLTLNKQENGAIKENPIGYLFMCIFIMCSSANFVVMRLLNQYSLHVSLNNGIQGIMFVLLSVFIYLFYGDLINIDKYYPWDIIALTSKEKVLILIDLCSFYI